MDHSEQDRAEVSRQLEALQDKAGQALNACHFATASRLFGDVARLSRSEGLIVPYIFGTFHQMDLALDLLRPDVAREKAIELVAILESEERARQIQPEDFPDAHYEWMVSRLSACTYENLAEATGRLDGYNSEGMHGCISEGIQVCRQTGKLACIRCFQEYAAEVYLAADDSDLALHHTRTIVMHKGDWSDRGNRRWFGSKNEGSLLLLDGQMEAAEAAFAKALEQTKEEKVSLPLQARLRASVEYEQMLLLNGKLDPTTIHSDSHSLRKERVPEGEYPANHLRWQWNDALALCCQKNYNDAIALLTKLDRWLTEHRCLSDWFETRLRLIAAYRLSDQSRQVEALANQLEKKAKEARDWLTMRRLEYLLNPFEPVTPLALLAPLTHGPFAAHEGSVRLPISVETGIPSSEMAAAVTTDEQSEAIATPLNDLIEELAMRLSNSEETDVSSVIEDILAVPPEKLTANLDAVRLLHMLRFLLNDGKRAAQIWSWVESVGRPFIDDPVILNLQAVLGDVLRMFEETPEDLIDVDRVDQLFRLSLDLDPNDAGNFARAGAFYLGQENMSEAERCLARGFRLERNNSFLALRLADVYRQTERPRDALAVLDICLREGCDDVNVAYEAGMLALQIEQYDSLLTYLDRFEEMEPGESQIQYFRALAFLELGRLEEATAAIAEEERRNPDQPFPPLVIRCGIAAKQNDAGRVREILQHTLQAPFSAVTYLTVEGITQLLHRLWSAATILANDDPARQELENRMLQASLAPDDYFELARQQDEPVENVHFYRCSVIQPLDAEWPQCHGCLHGQEAWEGYLVHWGVLALSEEHASQQVLDYQTQCYHLPPEIIEIQTDDGNYLDRPGVVWQGPRLGAMQQNPDAKTDDLIE